MAKETTITENAEQGYDEAMYEAYNAQHETDLRDHYLGTVAEDECPMCLSDAPDTSELSSPAGLASHAPDPSQYGAHGSKTIEQLRIEKLKAELAIEEEKLAEQRREVLKQEEEAKRQTEIQKRSIASQTEVDKLNALAAKLVVALATAGVAVSCEDAKVDKYGAATKPEFTNLRYDVRPCFDDRYSGGSSWRRGTRTGYQIVVGDYGNKKVFPQHKDSSFNFEKIANEVAARIARNEVERMRTEERKQEHSTAKLTLEYVAKNLGGAIIEGGYNHKGRYETRTPVLTMSAETAQKLYERLSELEVKAGLYDARVADDQMNSSLEDFSTTLGEAQEVVS